MGYQDIEGLIAFGNLEDTLLGLVQDLSTIALFVIGHIDCFGRRYESIDDEHCDP